MYRLDLIYMKCMYAHIFNIKWWLNKIFITIEYFENNYQNFYNTFQSHNTFNTRIIGEYSLPLFYYHRMRSICFDFKSGQCVKTIDSHILDEQLSKVVCQAYSIYSKEISISVISGPCARINRYVLRAKTHVTDFFLFRTNLVMRLFSQYILIHFIDINVDIRMHY